MRVVLSALLAVVSMFDARACEVSKASFEKVVIGMTTGQMERAIGCSGEITQETIQDGVRTVMYTWDGSAAGSFMLIMTQNEKVASRSQSGLR